LNRAGWTGWMFPEPRSVDFLLEAAFFDIPKLENWNWCLWYPTLGEYWFKGNLTKDFTKNPWLDTQYFGCIIYQYSWVVGFLPLFSRVKSIWSKIHPEIELVITEAQLWKAMVKLRCRQLEIPEDSALVDLRGVFFFYRKMATWINLNGMFRGCGDGLIVRSRMLSDRLATSWFPQGNWARRIIPRIIYRLGKPCNSPRIWWYKVYTGYHTILPDLGHPFIRFDRMKFHMEIDTEPGSHEDIDSVLTKGRILQASNWRLISFL
jgi:hypothetical protein